MFPIRQVGRIARQSLSSPARFASSAGAASSADKYKILVVGGGSGGLSVANQIYDRFKAAGKPLNAGDVAIIDPSEVHHYQPGWTLAGAGLRRKSEFVRPLPSLVPKHITLISDRVTEFSPASSSLTTTSGRSISYDSLVVAAGIKINWDGIRGLPQALMSSTSGVSSIYSYETCDKVWSDIDALRSGNAIFTQPAGVIKCAGAPQKIMWMAWDRYRRTNRGSNIKVDFYTGMPTMFSVKKYSDALEELRVSRGVGGFFGHNLTSIDAGNHKATFKQGDATVSIDYTVLHVTPPMGPPDFIKNSPIADAAGWVSVDPATLRHTNPEFSNIWSLGDCSSLPTSKTATAVIAQAPVLSENLFSVVDSGKLPAVYDGYTSCPLLTGYGELMMAEFRYGLEPKETFAPRIDQSKSNRFFYHLKKDFFPWVYFNYMVQGRWYGPKGIWRPTYDA
ncbi:sulfide-quinone oxidoreductase [Roridomyces roridus]|uniref:Sulfide:quinone oxidoreductase, mitochondrial n=1 Tax=Roridomyces roridus TaxID=1738132 RepID=A0AAD7BWD2_9AGAR|nr:sulfide-quinone oxidoreductase [Roridomyces roridus]